MTFLQSIALGALQGVAEFLPISSSGHLAVAQAIFGLDDVPLLYDIFLHLATLLAVIIFFRKKIISLCAVLFRWITRQKISVANDGGSDVTNADAGNACTSTGVSKEYADRKMIIAVIIATVITGALGIVTSKFIEDVPVKIVCAGFCVTGLILILSAVYEKRKLVATINSEAIGADAQQSTATVTSVNGAISVQQAIVIGVAQGIGTLPGISRSGSTISGALFCGVPRDVAGEFSFIVSIPAVLGAFVLEARHLGEVAGTVGTATVAVGCLTAFVTGYAALAFLMRLIKRGKFAWFAAYLIPLGILGIIFL